MRVAAIYDIHGNLPALEAVLLDIRQAHVDRVVVGGDVLPGPMPRETLWRLQTLDIPVQFITGNGDRVVREQMAGRESSEVPEQFREVIRWNAQQLRPEDEPMLAGWPKTVRMPIEGLGEVLFCHATPRNDIEIFTRLTSDERLLPVFEGLDVPVVVCGHTHMQFDRECRFRNRAPIGSYSGPAFSFGARPTISRPRLSAFEPPDIHRLKSLRPATCCNLRPRPRSWKSFRRPN